MSSSLFVRCIVKTGVLGGLLAAMFAPRAGAQSLVINEVDYDTIGTDTTEFIEIKNLSGSAVNLTGLSVVLVNGANNLEYARFSLSGAGMLAPGCYLVLVDDALTPPAGAPAILFSGTSLSAINNVQNGSPDGLAIVDTSASSIVDTFSYEGAITAAVITGYAGVVNLVQGTALPSGTADSNTVNISLIRTPDGQRTGVDANDWAASAAPSLGRTNSPCVGPALIAGPTSVSGFPTDTLALNFVTSPDGSPAFSWYYEGLAGRWHLLSDGLVGDPDTGLEFVVSGAATPGILVNTVTLRGHPNVIRFIGVARGACSGVQTAPASITILTCPCFADFDNSGGVPDTGDIDAYFVAWLAGEPSADADCSGGVPDSGDIDTFFQQWLAGGC